ncbi:YbaK/EbsC family protein [Nitratireductor rhodophyticola]
MGRQLSPCGRARVAAGGPRQSGAIVGDKVVLASEEETAALFPDCEEGAVPVFGAPYRIACMIDDELDTDQDVYFEGGDHRTLVHVTGKGFEQLMYGMPRAQISR